jgi:hypothetical protein
VITTFPFLNVFLPSGDDLVTDGVAVAAVSALTAPTFCRKSL